MPFVDMSKVSDWAARLSAGQHRLAIAMAVAGCVASGWLLRASYDVEPSSAAHQQAVQDQVSTLTCWSPDGKVFLQEKDLRHEDLENRDRNLRVFRGRRLIASVYYGVPCALVTQAPPPGAAARPE